MGLYGNLSMICCGVVLIKPRTILCLHRMLFCCSHVSYRGPHGGSHWLCRAANHLYSQSTILDKMKLIGTVNPISHLGWSKIVGKMEGLDE